MRLHLRSLYIPNRKIDPHPTNTRPKGLCHKSPLRPHAAGDMPSGGMNSDRRARRDLGASLSRAPTCSSSGMRPTGKHRSLLRVVRGSYQASVLSAVFRGWGNRSTGLLVLLRRLCYSARRRCSGTLTPASLSWRDLMSTGATGPCLVPPRWPLGRFPGLEAVTRAKPQRVRRLGSPLNVFLRRDYALAPDMPGPPVRVERARAACRSQRGPAAACTLALPDRSAQRSRDLVT
jgi:hypothetical protein